MNRTLPGDPSYNGVFYDEYHIPTAFCERGVVFYIDDLSLEEREREIVGFRRRVEERRSRLKGDGVVTPRFTGELFTTS